MIDVYSQNLVGVWFAVAVADQQIVATSFSENQQAALTSILTIVPYDTPFEVSDDPSDFAKDTLARLEKIYHRKNVDINLPLSYAGLPVYTQRVLKATLQIPVGYVSSYGLIAKAVGGGARAVGNIMASNPFAPIVPCHRVVKSDFKLGGYGGGLRVKAELLNREKRGFQDPSEIPIEGGNLKVFPVEVALRNLF
jgi:O-6-methylguanine DNA methyltransferase